MKRPLFLRLLPGDLRERFFFRYYARQTMKKKYADLYFDATLEYAPGVLMLLKQGDLISDRIAFTGTYERELSRDLIRCARRGGLFVDVGANIGYYSLLWCHANVANKAIVVEASPRNHGILQENLSRNNFTSQVQIEAVACGRTRGMMAFDLGPADQTGWGGLSTAAELSPASIQVPVVRLDELVPSDQYVTALKIDVEGADAWVLEGAKQLLKEKRIGQIWFEHNPTRMAALNIGLQTASEILKAADYKVTPYGSDGSCFFATPRPPAAV